MATMEQYREAMSRALFYANRARETGDVPVGAVVIDSLGRIVGHGWNCRESSHDPSGHAEIIALREAGKRLGRWNLIGCTLVVTLEPCTMCAGAAIQARVDRVVFGAWDPKAGAAGSLRDVLRDSRLNHQVEVIPGLLAEEATVQLRAFFESRRGESSPASATPPPPPADAAPPADRAIPPQLRPLSEVDVITAEEATPPAIPISVRASEQRGVSPVSVATPPVPVPAPATLSAPVFTPAPMPAAPTPTMPAPAPVPTPMPPMPTSMASGPSSAPLASSLPPVVTSALPEPVAAPTTASPSDIPSSQAFPTRASRVEATTPRGNLPIPVRRRQQSGPRH